MRCALLGFGSKTFIEEFFVVIFTLFQENYLNNSVFFNIFFKKPALNEVNDLVQFLFVVL